MKDTSIRQEKIVDLPNVVKEEAEATIAKSFSHGNLGRTIRFIAVSDAHNDVNKTGSYSEDVLNGNKHCGQAVKYIADRIGLDFIAFLGDATWAGTAQTADTYNQKMLMNDIFSFNDFIADGYKGIPNIRLVGNHDQLYTTKDTSARLWNSGAYNLFGRYCDGEKDIIGGYGYLDLDSLKVRIIYLNTSDIPSATTAGTYLGMTQVQKNWLCETLIDLNTKSDASSWRILILSHAPLDLLSGISDNILLAYTNGGVYESYTFNNNYAPILANVHGHVHCYSYGYMNEKIRRFCIPNSNFVDNNHYAGRSGYEKWADTETYHKTANSGKDTAFSLVTIDLDNDKCYVDNYGAGIDRIFSTNYKPSETIVPTSISNISYNGDTTVGQSINKLKFTFTVTYSNGTTRTVTGATSISPETISVVGNNAVTISYTEEGTTVTGTTTIVGTDVGTEVPTVNLLNLDRTYVAGTTGESVGNALDETKAYTNVAYGAITFNDRACAFSDVSENSVTVTESGLGGIVIAYPIHLPDLATQDYTLSFDYSGSGKQRVYYRLCTDSGSLSASKGIIDDTAGASGTKSVTISTGGQAYTWLIVMLSSNTSATKSYTNVKLEKVT